MLAEIAVLDRVPAGLAVLDGAGAVCIPPGPMCRSHPDAPPAVRHRPGAGRGGMVIGLAGRLRRPQRWGPFGDDARGHFLRSCSLGGGRGGVRGSLSGQVGALRSKVGGDRGQRGGRSSVRPVRCG